MNIMILSHGILGSTGFSRVIYQIATALRDEGHEIFVPNQGYVGKSFRMNDVTSMSGEDYSGINILGYGKQRMGEDVVPEYMKMYDIDLVITLGDIWAYQYIRQIPGYGKWRWIAYYALDTENLVKFWIDNIGKFDIPVVMSEFGQRLCGRHKLNVKHIPHAVDTELFKPATDDEKMELRAKLRIPQNAFVIGCVAHNHRRKMLDKLFFAFTLFVKSHPNAILALHTQPDGGSIDGWSLQHMVDTYGLTDNVLFTNYNSKGIGDSLVTDADLRDFYCTMDVHMLLTGGEGFGIPFIESAACGIPNITTNYTTGPELFGKKGGILVPVDTYHTHPTGGLWALANVDKAVEALELLYDDEDKRVKMGQDAREHMVDKYDLERIQSMWVSLIDGVNVSEYEHEDTWPFGCYTLKEMVEKHNAITSKLNANGGVM